MVLLKNFEWFNFWLFLKLGLFWKLEFECLQGIYFGTEDECGENHVENYRVPLYLGASNNAFFSIYKGLWKYIGARFISITEVNFAEFMFFHHKRCDFGPQHNL